MIEGAVREVLAELGIDVIAKNGSGWLCCACPFAPLGFHKSAVDNNPSFFVKPNSSGVSGFNCFSCHEHGTLSSLVAKLEYHSGDSYGNLSTRTMLKELQVSFGEFGEFSEEDKPPQILEDALYAGVYDFAWESLSAIEYLESRGIDKHSAIVMGLLYDEEQSRVLFPVRNYAGGLWGFTGRAVDSQSRAKVKDYAGLKKKWALLGEDLVRKSDECGERKPLLLVEGLFAYAHLVAIGARECCNPIASMGSYLSTQQRDRIVAMGRPLYVLYDDDMAGDIGLFGKQDPKTDEHLGGGAIDLMKMHVPTFLGFYPEYLSEGDPDLLTLDDVKWIISQGNELCS